MLYQVVSGKLTHMGGFQRIHFTSRSLDECWNFIGSRLRSINPSVMQEAYDFYVVDSLGVRQNFPSKKIA